MKLNGSGDADEATAGELEALFLKSDEGEESDDEEEKPAPKAKPVVGDDDAEPEPEPDDDDDEDDGIGEELRSLFGKAPKPEERDENIESAGKRVAPQTVVQRPAADASDAEMQAFLAKVAGGTDVGSRFMQALIRNAHGNSKKLEDFMELQEVPKKGGLRTLVKKEYESGDYRTVRAAHDAVLGKLVRRELKLSGTAAKAKPKAKSEEREPLTETLMVTGGGRKASRFDPKTISEIPESVLYKALDRGGRLAQILSQRYRSTGPDRLKVVRNK
jgi:hypothetical protein